MPNISATDIRKGLILRVDGQLYAVVDFEHITPGKGQAVMQTKLRHIQAGHHTNKRFRSSEKVEQVFLQTQEMEFLYRDGDSYCFMNTQTYEQTLIPDELLGDLDRFLSHNALVRVVFYEGRAISVDVPAAVVLEVIETEPGVKGDTVTNVFKPATLDTGLQVRVPLFVKKGDKVKVDTRTGEFMERAS